MTEATDTGAQRQDTESLFKACAAAAHRAAFSVLRSSDAADDIAQDACVEVLTAIREGKSIDNPRQWAATAAYHRALLVKKRSRPEVELEESIVAPEAFKALGATELAWKACEQLTDAKRTAVVMSVVEGFTAAEVGQTLDVSTAAAHKLIQRGIQQMLKVCVDSIGQRRGMPAGCDNRSTEIYELVVGKLSAPDRESLDSHLATCEYCQETREQLDLARQLPAFAPLFPLDGIMSRKREVLRAVASRSAAPASAVQQRTIRPSRVIGGAAVLLLLVIGGLSIPSIRPQPPARIAAAARPSPSPTLPPTPTPAPPAPPSGGYAYISNGHLFYSQALGATPVQLTGVGEHVDNFWWAANGRSLVYKANSPGTSLGDLHQLDLATKKVTWSLTAATAFAFSPDGSAYVAAVPIHSGDSWNYRLEIGSPGSAPDPTREVDLDAAASDTVVAGYLNEVPPVMDFFQSREPTIWWTPAGIHFEPGGGPFPGYDIDPSTKVVSRRQIGFFDPLATYIGPAGSPIRMPGPAPSVTVTVNGSTTAVPFQGGTPLLLSVNQDLTKGLVSVIETTGGHDIYAVGADGSVAGLSTDGNSGFAVWQPPVTSQ